MNKWVTVLLIGFPGLGWGFDSPFVTFSKHFSFKEKFEIPGMPIVRDQRSLGICFSAAAAVLADFQFCKKIK